MKNDAFGAFPIRRKAATRALLLQGYQKRGLRGKNHTNHFQELPGKGLNFEPSNQGNGSKGSKNWPSIKHSTVIAKFRTIGLKNSPSRNGSNVRDTNTSLEKTASTPR
jgi:hypothetical protein